jgi:hypothetical protein
MKLIPNSFCFSVLPVTSILLLAICAASCNSALAQNHPASAPAPRSSGSTLAWVSFQDPFEKAFTLEVPRGWTAKGGLFRMGYSDERPMVDLTSPDGRINVRLGDVSIPVYTSPVQFHPEGTVYDLGAQAQLIVARYRQGPEFAALYSRVRFYRICQNPVADTADLGPDMPDYIPADGPPPAQTSAGQIASHCTTDQGQRVALAFARTSLLSGGIWTATTLGSFFAPPDQVGLARSVLEHCARTFTLSPEWIERQKQMDADALVYQRARQQRRMQELAAQVQQFDAQMQAMRSQVDSFRRRQDAQAAQVTSFTQALRGVTPTLDPLTGESREVWTGAQANYWSNGNGGVANSALSPGAGWHQLQVTSP